MSAVAAIKLAHAANGGVLVQASATVAGDHTYSPERKLPGGIARYVDRSVSSALGYNAFHLSVRPPTEKSRIYRVGAKLIHPVLETIDPAVGIYGPVLAYQNQVNAEFLLSERSTQAERLALFYAFTSLFFTTINASDGNPSEATGSPLIAAVRDFEDVYG